MSPQERKQEEKVPDTPSSSEMEDLRDFIAADELPCEADPSFRFELKEKLWARVKQHALDASASPHGSQPETPNHEFPAPTKAAASESGSQPL